ncbi:NUC189-domain-containing protein [Corynespora cassiicola Philippines]|uniref:NUC189-domain-containing protein n=1 Tax=Corynespora cassiicola Philippines TaxID=1448308 RepID=A0A2T2N7D5_CORCC|nr:NUC189-domain-containing protein [Corynespora cassiicola Philippines]
MPAAVASRSARNSRAARDPPPAKKTKLSQSQSQSPAAPRQNGLKALLSAAPNKKPAVAARSTRNNAKKDARVEDATAVVSGGQAGHGDVDMGDAGDDVIEISSAEEESVYSSSGDEADADAAAGAQEVQPPSGHAEEEDQPVEDGEELSFGERLRAQEPESARTQQIVDVESAFVGPSAESRALATASNSRPLSAPSATSLGTVLTQALRTNDQELLDSCLRVIDVDTIYATIERLPSPLVGTLLQKLAERLHKQRGRAAMGIVWLQWSLVAHGGYLASQPQLVRQLATLNKVLKERASGLQPLLSLKGRLDMLQAQMELRRRNQRAADDEDDAVIYVEGEDDYSSGGDDASDAGLGNSKKRTWQQSDDAESSDDEMPTTMEVDEDSEGSEDSQDLLDEEAEETDNDTGDDMSEPMSDDNLDDGEGVSGSEEESKPAKRSTAGRAKLPRRF